MPQQDPDLAPTVTPFLTGSHASMEWECNPNQVKPATVLPGQEVTGIDGLIGVHVPF